MKRILLTATVLAAIAGGGFALAQAQTPSADDHAAHPSSCREGTKGGFR